MADNTIDVEVVPIEIVRCPRCGSRNRLLKQKKRVAYRCGECAAPLENPFLVQSIVTRRFQEIARRVSSPRFRKYIVLLMVGILVIFVVLRRPDESPPHGLNEVLTPPLQMVKIISQPAPAPLEKPAVPPRSLANGTILTELTAIGHGRFIVRNNTDRDAVVKLVDEAARHSVVAVYVTGYSSAAIEQIPEGSFVALCGQGVDWDDSAKVFRSDTSFGKFDQNLNFVTKVERSEHQIIRRHQYITLELAPSITGNITRSKISEETFLEY